MRRLGHREAIRRLLSDGKMHRQDEMLRVGGYRYGARVMELRRDGVDIETVALGDGRFGYQLARRAVQGRLL